ncbi:MAG: Nif3-like dinuclear metal center hexameric protein [Clostridiales bacterium]|nr:Nif3-like dinuclear metal center hexameric protein [Candidatus Blautia equi]
MIKKELLSYLEEHYPCSAAEGWDNVGLLVGDAEGEIHHVFLALDLTEPVLAEAIACGADFILTHHPMIFSGVKRINHKTFEGRKILSLIRNGITYYAMHTNYDVLGMAHISSERMGLKEVQPLEATYEDGEDVQGIGSVGTLPEKMTLRACAELVKKAFDLPEVRVFGNLDKEVVRAAMCTGSGKSMIKNALGMGAEVYITGDIDHHSGIDAVADGLCIIDAGHYGTEYMFMEEMEKELAAAFPELKLTCAGIKFPYTMI